MQAVFGDRIADPAVRESVDAMRADYEHQLDAKHAGARGFVDAILVPEDTRVMLAFALQITGIYRGPHIGPFVMPPLDYQAP